MKFVRISGLLFVPLALSAAVPQKIEVYQINDNGNGEATALMLEQQGLADNMFTLKMGLAIFFSEAHRVANQAIREQTELLQIEDGPSELSELLDIIFSTASINREQVPTNASTTTAVINPLQNLLNGIGGAINSLTGEVAGIISNVTGSKVQNGTVALNGTNPISGILNVIGGDVNNILRNVSNIFGSVAGGTPSKNGTANAGLGGLLGNIANSTAALLGGIGNSTGPLLSGIGNSTGQLLGGIANGTGSIITGVTDGTGQLLGSITNGTGSIITGVTGGTGVILGNITNGLVNGDVLKSVLGLVNGTLTGILTGNLSIGHAIDDIIGSISQATSADNPLGKFLQNLANYLSNNQDGILANIIKFSTFVNAVSGAIAALITNSTDNINANVTKAVSDVILGVIDKVLGGGLIHRTQQQELNAEDFVIIRNMFLDVMHDATPVTTTYTQELIDLFGKVSHKVMAADPQVLSFIINPTDENVKRFVNTISKVLNEHH